METYLPEGMLLDTPENAAACNSLQGLRDAMAKGTVLEAVAVKAGRDCSLHLDLGAGRGVIPKNEGALGVGSGQTRDVALITRVGRPVQFVVTGFAADAAGSPVALCSRRLAQEKCAAAYLDRLRPGDALNAVVTHTEGFGAFCDVGAGVPALLPVDHISVSRIAHPADRLALGQTVRVLLKSRDLRGRLTLTMKELLGTWEENAGRIGAGETVTGVVRGVEPYGVFVELFPNLAGLAEPNDACVPGQGCVVYIKSVNPEKMKIKLSIVSVSSAPARRAPLEYLFKGAHMDRFVYSPSACPRVVETVF